MAMRRTIARKKLKFYNIDAVKIAGEVGLGGRINMIMQTAFFKAANVIPVDDAITYLKDQIQKDVRQKGRQDRQHEQRSRGQNPGSPGGGRLPGKLGRCRSLAAAASDEPEWVTEVMQPMLAQQGDKLPVSAFSPDGIFPVGTTQYEKRGVAINVPEWVMENCIQCNQCAMVCPHAAIRPVLVTEDELKALPRASRPKKPWARSSRRTSSASRSFRRLHGLRQLRGHLPGQKTGPGHEAPDTQTEQQVPNQRYASSLPVREGLVSRNTVKGSQFYQPLLEFSGACAGCGETPYAKLLTQLFGDRMVIGNATGCSSIWGGSAPSIPYCVNEEGCGPTWGNSLFEDPAEFTYGMFLGQLQQRQVLIDLVTEALDTDIDDNLKAAMQGWLENMKDADGSKRYGDQIREMLFAYSGNPLLDRIDSLGHTSPSVPTGSSWVTASAYDISFGGIDHVLATGEDINVIVYDTEVYSNTGGQSSKATPTGSIAKFAASGKKTAKKDLGGMAMTYGYVYVASVGMGANKQQMIKAFTKRSATTARH
jgi:pyruvate-ferredoxin/flavodoxin oxidoreductase